MRMTHLLRATCTLLCTILFFASGLIGQSETATISGLITDSQGAVVPAAEVQLQSAQRGTSQTATTNGAGIYIFPSIQPGSYQITVRKQGFKQVDFLGMVVNVQDHVEQNFKLEIGSISESITVEGNGINLNTTDGSVSTVINRTFVDNTPLNGRSFQDLILLTPGVVTESPQNSPQTTVGTGGDFSVNGQRTESNYYTVDGVSANNFGGNSGTGAAGPGTSGSISSATALGTTQSLISVDSLQEFRVQSSSYSAEFGRSPGGQFAFASRSGTNDFHGTLFDYVRNDAFDANNWFNDFLGVQKQSLRQNDFGGTLGGPVRIPRLYDGKDKTFFFLSYEGLRLLEPTAASVQYVPSTLARSSAPQALQGILNAFPLPTPGGIDYGDGLAEFIQSYSLPSDINAISGRFDEILSPKLSLFFRFSDTPSSQGTRALSVVGALVSNGQTYTLGATSQFSGEVVNELRVGYSRASYGQEASLDNFGGAQPINLSEAVGTGAYPNAFPYFVIFTSNGFTELNTANSGGFSRNWNITDSVSWTAGSHHIKAGFDYRRVKSQLNEENPVAEIIYESLGSIQANAADYGIVAKSYPGTPIYDELSFFAQDQWQVNSRLSIAPGLRWDINPAPTDAHGQDPYTLLGNINDPQSLTLAPRGTPLWKTTWFNFAPRLGVAYVLRNSPGWATVVRGGGGVFFDTGNEYASRGYGGIGFGAEALYAPLPLPLTPSQLNLTPSTSPPYTGSTAYGFSPHLQLPYTLEWNVSVEQALEKQQTLTLSYVGASGRRLLEQEELSLQAVNPEFGNVIYSKNGLTSNYQSLQAKYQRTLSHGLQAIGSYTWSHSIDYGSSDAALAYRRGNSDFDLRHQFTGGLSWDPQYHSKGGVIGTLARGWGLDTHFEARSGFPVNLNGTLLTDPATGAQYYSGVNFNPGVPVYLYGSAYPGGRRLNPLAFSVVSQPGQNGDVPRNFFRGFGAVQLNVAVRRTFTLYEGLKLQFRAEAFNVLNHPMFGYIDPSLTSSTFGEATNTLNENLRTMSPLYQQGGPRSLQFAVKLLF